MTTTKNLLVFLLAILCPGIGLGQAKPIAKDTVFLFRGKTAGAYHAVYIDPNRSSPVYKQLLDFQWDKEEKKEYQSGIAYLKKQNPAPLVRHQLYDLPRQWCPLYRWKNQYYLYSPCDYIAHYRLYLSDSTYAVLHSDSRAPDRINSLKKNNDQTYTLVITDSYEGVKTTIVIHLLDKKRGIAVFETRVAGEKTRYKLMVSAKTARYFPVIVHSCKTQKQMEYEFPAIDYKKLMATKGKK